MQTEFVKVVGPFQCNCRVLVCPVTAEALVIDPGDDGAALTQWLHQLKTPDGRPIRVHTLLHTHAHLDHIGATRELHENFPDARILLHKGDLPLYRDLKSQGRLFGMEYLDPVEPTGFCAHEEELFVGQLRLSVIHTPGHSPGSVCFRLHEDRANAVRESLYSGDTLFRDSVGRTDLWGADSQAMFKSIHERILTLDGDTRVCPGHGPNTTVGRERFSNPFLQ